jgi:hypothetical protein
MWSRIRILAVPICLAILMLNSIIFLIDVQIQPVAHAMPLANPIMVAAYPPANSHTEPVTTAIFIQYDQPINPTSVNTKTFVVHAMQTGLITQSYTVNDNSTYLTPTYPFKPGELVYVSATTGTFNLAEEHPIAPTVWQFRTDISVTVALFGV